MNLSTDTNTYGREISLKLLLSYGYFGLIELT